MAFLYTLLSQRSLGNTSLYLMPASCNRIPAGVQRRRACCSWVFLITKEYYNLFTCTQTGGKMNLCLSWDQYIYIWGRNRKWRETIFGSQFFFFWRLVSWISSEQKILQKRCLDTRSLQSALASCSLLPVSSLTKSFFAWYAAFLLCFDFLIPESFTSPSYLHVFWWNQRTQRKPVRRTHYPEHMIEALTLNWWALRQRRKPLHIF